MPEFLRKQCAVSQVLKFKKNWNLVIPKQSASEFLALKDGSADARDFFAEKYGGGIFRIVNSIVDDPVLANEITIATLTDLSLH